jgi:hypothetical protein
MSGLALVRRRGPKGPLARTKASGLKNLSTLKTYNHLQMICSKVIYALKVLILHLSYSFFSLGKPSSNICNLFFKKIARKVKLHKFQSVLTQKTEEKT